MMCTKIEIDGQYLETMGDFKAVVGDEKLFVKTGYPLSAYYDEFCLCALDLEATARVLGRKIVYDGTWTILETRP